ncbi:MAG: ABC transporter substrate-binding protein [Syntrophobacteraceae bacterium]|jgi:NitT/TauT family transport system substrate-binding protein
MNSASCVNDRAPFGTWIENRALLLACILFLLSFPVVSTADESVSFLPQWSPQAQFTGYYTAYAKGFYKKYGIDLTIITGGPDKQALDWLEKGKADFATAWLSTALGNRSRGVKLLNVAQMVQRSALMLVARKSSGISKPEDLNGKKVSIWGGDFAIQPGLFFKQYGLKVETIRQAYTLNLFLRGGVDAASAMLYNEYHTIINSGINPEELSTIFYYDHGLNFPEDGIYTLEETFSKKPGTVCAFVKASIEGWLYAFSHTDEALDIVLEYMKTAGVPANRVHQKWMLEKMKDLMRPGGADAVVGTLAESDYYLVSEKLREAGLIAATIPFRDFYRPCNVEK